MGLTDILINRTIYLDTAPFIYYIESVSPYADLLEPVFQLVQRRNLQVYTSSLTIAETLVVPYRKKDHRLVSQFVTLLTQTPDLTVLPLTIDIAAETAKIRADYSFRTPDAIQLATAMVCGCDAFLTNDKSLNAFSPLQIVLLDDFVHFSETNS